MNFFTISELNWISNQARKNQTTLKSAKALTKLYEIDRKCKENIENYKNKTDIKYFLIKTKNKYEYLASYWTKNQLESAGFNVKNRFKTKEEVVKECNVLNCY